MPHEIQQKLTSCLVDAESHKASWPRPVSTLTEEPDEEPEKKRVNDRRDVCFDGCGEWDCDWGPAPDIKLLAVSSRKWTNRQKGRYEKQTNKG